jgi:hypothetical protein
VLLNYLTPISIGIAALVLGYCYRAPSFATSQPPRHPLVDPVTIVPWVVIIVLVLGAHWSAEQIIALVGALLGTGMLPGSGGAGSPAASRG